MVINNFRDLIKKIESIDSETFRKETAKQLKQPARRFNRHIINFLQEKNYPLRKGIISQPITKNRIDPIYGRTPTQRLHGMTLAEGQLQPRFYKRKKRNTHTNVRILFTNKAEHANLFFEETKPHTIPANNEKGLVFWVGFSNGVGVPWHPPYVGNIPGPRIMDIDVSHPGTLAYNRYINEIFEQHYEKPFSDTLTSISNAVITSTLERL